MDYYDGDVLFEDPDSSTKIYRAEEDPESLDTEFRRKFPPEQLGREMDDGARVWKVYRDEATANDATTLDGWSKTLDILLIFAGLFSAVATAFVIESYKSLQLDSGTYTANALYALLNHASPSSAASLPRPPPLDASPSELSRWINGLWFTSLVLALAVALLCILVKQWISEYIARNSASARNARDWARRHQVYFQALSRWPVGQLVAVLPLMLHISLFLFIAGVAVFLWDLDLGIGIWVIVLGTGLIGFYLACFLLPLWYPEAPTSTPLVHQVRHALAALRISYWRYLVGLLGFALRSVVFLSTHPALQWSRNRVSVIRVSLMQHFRTAVTVHGSPITSHPSLLQRLRDFRSNVEEKIVILVGRGAQLGRPTALLSQDATLDTDALKWLILCVPDSDAVAVGLQALGARGPNVPWVTALRHNERIMNIPPEDFLVHSGGRLHPVEVMRAVRSLLCLRTDPEGGPSYFRTSNLLDDLPDAMEHAIALSNQPDAVLFCASRRSMTPSPDQYSPSLIGTVLTIFQSHSVKLDNAMSVLSGLDFQSVPAVGWGIILDYFRQCPFRTDDRIMITPRDKLQYWGWRELFFHAARFLKVNAVLYLNGGGSEKVLLRRIFSSFGSGELSDRNTEGYATPLVVRYILAERTWWLWDAPRVVLQEAISFLASTASYKPDADHRSKYLEQRVQASAYVLRACRFRGYDTSLKSYAYEVALGVYGAFSILFKRAVPDSYSRGGTIGSRTNPEVTCEHIEIEFHSYSEVWRPIKTLFAWRYTVWDSLFRLEDCNNRWWLTDHIAAALCTLRRGDATAWSEFNRQASRVSDEGLPPLATFLSQIPLRTLVDAMPAGDHGSEDSYGERAVRIASHCIELCPEWWIHGIEDIISRDVTEDTCRRVLRLGIDVQRYGYCNKCPARVGPREWNIETLSGP